MSIYITKSARYYDGKTGAARDVELVLGSDALSIMQGHDSLDSWDVTKIKILSEPDHPAPASITIADNPDARLLIEDGEGWKILYPILLHHSKKRFSLPTSLGAFFCYIIVSVSILVFLFMIFPRLIEASAYLIPSKVEKMIGERVVGTLIDGEACSNPEGVAALDKLVGRLAQHTKRKIDYRVFVAHSPMQENAFSTLGGNIVFYSGLIEGAKSPDEVAGVLAHEMAHIDLYHTTKGLMRDLGFYVVLSMMFDQVDYIQFAGFLNQVRYSKEDEQAADTRAVELLEAAGMNAEGLVAFFKHNGGIDIDVDAGDYGGEVEKLFGLLNYLSTHPRTDHRIRRVEDLSSGETVSPAMSEKEWEALRNICASEEGEEEQEVQAP